MIRVHLWLILWQVNENGRAQPAAVAVTLAAFFPWF
jgi:hypothetical protein